MTPMLLALLIAVHSPAAAASGAAPACKPQSVDKKIKLSFPSGKAIAVDVVDTPLSRQIGLMCRAKLPADYGMLFVFPREMDLSFWMKNTLVSLDIIWIGADKKVTVIRDHMKKSRADASDSQVAAARGRGQYVLELTAGAAARRGLKAGDELKFETLIPSY